MLNLTTSYLTKNPCYKSGRQITVKGLMLHSVGCPQPNPQVFINNWNKESYDSACVHGFIGEDETFLTLPCMEKPGKAMRGWHGGGKSNNTHIGIEMCEPKHIKYTRGATFTCSDKAAAVAYVKKVTQNAVELFAMLCAYHGLDPLVDIVSHAEGHALGIASNHGDPDHLWAQLDMDYNMDSFRREVAAYMKKEQEDDADMANIDEIRSKITACGDTGDNPSKWAEDATEYCKRKGIFNGNGQGDYGWQQPITREAVAQVIYNLLDTAGMLEKLPDV